MSRKINIAIPVCRAEFTRVNIIGGVVVLARKHMGVALNVFAEVQVHSKITGSGHEVDTARLSSWISSLFLRKGKIIGACDECPTLRVSMR